MSVADLLSTERVQLRADLRSKKRVLEELAALLSQAASKLDKQDIFISLINREKLGSTGLGGGVAIPHGRVRGLDTPVGALLRLKPGVDYEANDGQPADLVFGLLVPEQATDTHLRILRALAEMFTDDSFCARLREAPDSAALNQLLCNYVPAPEAA